MRGERILRQAVIGGLCLWVMVCAALGAEGVNPGASPGAGPGVKVDADVDADPVRVARREAMVAERARLVAQLERVPDDLPGIKKKIAGMKANDWQRAGLGPKAVREWNAAIIAQGRSVEEAPRALAGLVQFHQELRRRGIDLIVMPMPDHPMVYGHRLFDGVGPEADLAPGYTRMLIALLDQDIEVIDLCDDFRKAGAAEKPGDPPVLRPNDHHWASTGIAIGAQRLSERLQRYPFVKAMAPGQKDFTTRPAKFDNKVPAIEIVYAGPAPEARTDTRTDRKEYYFWADWPHPILLMGDSMVYHQTYDGKKRIKVGSGMGFPQHLSMELGSLVPYRGRAAGGSLVPRDYFRRFGEKDPAQPRVLVWVASASALVDDGWPQIKSVPQPRLVTDDRVREMSVTLTALSPVPDPKVSAYKDALIAHRATITTGPEKGTTIVLVQQVMRDHRLIDAAAKLQKGQSLQLRVEPLESAEARDPKLTQMQTIDMTDDLMSPRYLEVE